MARTFEELFPSEEACHQHLFRLRWPEGFRCPRCRGDACWQVSRDLYRCQKCDHQASVTSGTIFHGSRRSLRVWFRAMWYVTNQKLGVSALGLMKELDLGSYHTAWAWMQKLRTAMVRPGRDRLGGKVEVGVTYLGGRKPGKRGRGASGKTVVVVVVQDLGNRIGRIRLRRIRSASAENLAAVVREEVEPGAQIFTDGWRGFGGLPEMGYRHIVVPKGGGPGETALPMVNRVVELIYRWLQRSHQVAVRPSYMDYYLDEFTFLFNRRSWRSREWLFFALIQQAAAVAPLPVRVMRSRKHPVASTIESSGPPRPPLLRTKAHPDGGKTDGAGEAPA